MFECVMNVVLAAIQGPDGDGVGDRGDEGGEATT